MLLEYLYVSKLGGGGGTMTLRLYTCILFRMHRVCVRVEVLLLGSGAPHHHPELSAVPMPRVS